MPLIEWTSALSVGIDDLDEDHRFLFAAINRLDEAISDGDGHTAVARTFTALRDFTETHFSKEEGFLHEKGYDELDAHKAMHRGFERRLEEFQDRHQRDGSDGMDREVLNFLVVWIIEHIKREDMRYKDFFRQNGVI
jgi:hemerythrin